MKTYLMADPVRYPTMTTGQIRAAFLIDALYEPGAIRLAYVDLDRAVVGMAAPLESPIVLPADEALRAKYFAERRELGALNIGGNGVIRADGKCHPLENLDCLYIGRGARDISFESHCEHHMAPIIGRAHIGYLPTNKVVGISKLARVVEGYARRFQVQEKLTAEIANCINDVLKPRGVGVVIDATHECMTTRGIHKRGVSMVTSRMTGTFRDDARTRMEFLQFVDIRAAKEVY